MSESVILQGKSRESIGELSQGVVGGVIPCGRLCSIAPPFGSHDDMDAPIYDFSVNGRQKVMSQYVMTHYFFHYINFIHQVDECYLVTDLYLLLD
ncbi:hypothetical protein G3465_18535 [Shewanella baltica]|uniref:hypothetical protein n=1 Tax=Shewanella baltica TaxID=62322 RepID=UPI00217E0932|nr:hypothetical protein [Shewanella baltica]MCS6154874.1 hypothetical protein [Shewanella baltica]